MKRFCSLALPTIALFVMILPLFVACGAPLVSFEPAAASELTPVAAQRVANWSRTPTPAPANTIPVTPEPAFTPVSPTPYLTATLTPSPTPYYTPDSGMEAGDAPPYCRPDEASVELSASAGTVQVGERVTVTVRLVNGGTSGARLGQIQYMLRVKPPGIFSSADWGPVESTLTLEPGEGDATRFVLQAETPGSATLDGLASYEMHALDTFWGSWSGCHPWPIEINVTP
jgi:hypothetical protein